MKKLLLYCLLIAIVAACNKNDEDQADPVNTADVTQLNNGVTTGLYAPYTTGSVFNYKNEDAFGTVSSSTWTVLGGTTINEKFFIEIEGFMGLASKGYFNCEGGNYTVYIPATGLTPDLFLVYMKDNVPESTEWMQNITLNLSGVEYINKYVFSVESTLENKTVEGVEYSDVLHIHLDTYTIMMGQEILGSMDDYYWAKGIGLIEKSGLSGNMYLISYTIQ